MISNDLSSVMLPVNLAWATERTHFADTSEKLHDVVHLLQRLDATVLALDFGLQNQEEVPRLLGVAALVGDTVVRSVLDLRAPGIQEAIAEILRSGVRVAAHDGRPLFYWLKSIGVEYPDNVFDSHLSALTLNLGRFDYRYECESSDSISDEIRAKEAARQKRLESASLPGLCRKYGIQHHHLFLNVPASARKASEENPGRLFQADIERTAAAAEVIARLYLPLSLDLVRHDLLLRMELEFAYARANFECESNGVRLSPEKCAAVRDALPKVLARMEEDFRQSYRVEDVQDQEQLKFLFQQLGILECFSVPRKSGRYDFSSKKLKPLEHRYEAVRLLRKYQKLRAYLGDPLLVNVEPGTDGRVRLRFEQLGTNTGRTNAKSPALPSIYWCLRPLVIPEEGYSIGECDLCQIEMGVLAALSGDPALIAAYNSGDIYVATAKRYFSDRLTPAQKSYSIQEFKVDPVTAAFRETMKTVCLAIINRMTAAGLRRMLGGSEFQARREIERFFEQYPVAHHFLETTTDYSVVRGYARSVTGLRRLRGREGYASWWERNALWNFPIQASAGDLFKKIVVRLDREYRAFGARLIIQNHDAVVFEALNDVFMEVAVLTQNYMEEVVSEMFPVLRGKAELNIKAPWCWSKNGQHDSIEKLLKDSDFKI